MIPSLAVACYPAADDMLLIPSTAVPDARLAAAYIIFLASYLVFAIGKFPGLKIDRPGAAIIGAVAMIAFRVVQPSDALRFIDFSTLVLLFSMMLIVGNLRLVGFFEWNAEVVLQRLKPTHLLPAVIFTCGFLSAFLVNDIVCLVMVPFVLGITRRMQLQPLPYLLGGRHRVEYWQRGDDYRQSAEYVDWVFLRHSLLRFSFSSGSGRDRGTVSRLGRAALDSYARH